MPEELVVIRDIAGMLGVTVQRVHQLIQTDPAFPPPARKFGRQRIWYRRDIEPYIEQRRGKQD